MAYTTIDKGSEYFNTVTYTGDGNTTKAITGVGFQPDLVWGKTRSDIRNHQWIDSIRGVTQTLQSNLTNAELSSDSSGFLASFDSDGFTTQIGSFDNGNFNVSGRTYVAWNFKANGAGVSNTDGSITSTVSANTTSGFSIVSYTGTGANATVGHGLGVAPKMIIARRRDSIENWLVYHNSIGATKYLNLNLTNAEATASSVWNNTSPTSSVFSVGTASLNNSGGLSIAYCFAEVKGYSKMGSYVANGSSDGNFIYTGFTPAFILTKCSSTDNGSTFWCIFDNKREGYNGANDRIFPNVSNAESNDSPSEMDILSNGFKIRGVSSSHNISGQTFIYMAFAENPFVTSTSIPTTAR